MKRLLIPLVVISFLIILGLFSFSWWKTNSQPVSEVISQQRFVIPKGLSAAEVGAKLSKQGLIKNPLAFKIYVQVGGKAKKMQAGEYNLSPSLSLPEIVEKLTQGPDELWVIIPEGLRREEIVERLIESLEMAPGQAASFKQEFLKLSEGKEGFLFPDTYLFARDTQADLVVRKLMVTFDEKIMLFKDEIDSGPHTLNQIITLASIIERETATDEERPVVAGILLKRLEAGVALQTDATVQYAQATQKCGARSTNCEWWPVITRQDLEIASSYNTYKFTGLPPGPIANPGLSSIEAVVAPQGSPYWYYIHDSEGGIHYARTLEEHNGNIRRYLGK